MTDVDLRLGRWQDVLSDITCDTLIVDAPYSERTHAGQRHGRKDPKYSPDSCLSGSGLDYASLSSAGVREFVESWEHRCRGWFCSITSHDLAPEWATALNDAGRYVFAPIPCVQIGMNVRLAGDGPSNWTCWAVVSRPKSREFQRWGTLPGAYVDTSERKAVVGGKPLRLMRAIVRDYSRPGDLVCDPCAGGGTTLLAARMEGRRAIGAEMMPEHYEIARRRLSHLPVSTETQPALFDT